MRQATVLCNEVQTSVISEGRWIEEEPSAHSSKYIILVLPGNPGVPQFYQDFIKAINSKLTLDIPVWIIGHAGHVQPPKDLDIAMPSDTKWNKYYGLTAQIQHKVDFIKKYVPEDGKVFLIGHSIGAWFALNLLKDDDVSRKIEKCYLLFPTIERMEQSRNGRFFSNIISRLAPLLIFMTWMFGTILPVTVQILLIRIFGLFYGIPAKYTKIVREMLNPVVLRRIINLAREEMRYVREADYETISQHADKLWFYYGAKDGWTPVKYYREMKARYPKLNAQLCQRGFQHSFVLKNDIAMGHIVGDLINNESL